MTITTGDSLPNATVLTMGPDGPTGVDIHDKIKGRKVVIFGLPGAYTGTCTTAHVPSFIRTAPQLRDKGVEEIICLSVNDPFVMQAWGEATGAIDAGITMLGDVEAAFTKAIGMNFTAPPVGFIDRSRRYAMLVDNGVVTILNEEPGPGQCDISGGENLLDQMG
ncbi:Peroxiredoxin [Loktanella sp. DSM 29012]|uniref:Glutathione-dependent peroxiredoxin n=1 Tax=Loktanella gaetbuli TaxID=2881335 RepID=A0ABS8BSV3_9RHOB|nr:MULTISPECIES: peroxiredoxin [Loktanella]MCB5198820.1 peroxiredoxin [Loktanella gaetbuli]SEQ74204.1 Peroxiredoxin [Loktanella sp. DSM 29012]